MVSLATDPVVALDLRRPSSTGCTVASATRLKVYLCRSRESVWLVSHRPNSSVRSGTAGDVRLRWCVGTSAPPVPACCLCVARAVSRLPPPRSRCAHRPRTVRACLGERAIHILTELRAAASRRGGKSANDDEIAVVKKTEARTHKMAQLPIYPMPHHGITHGFGYDKTDPHRVRAG